MNLLFLKSNNSSLMYTWNFYHYIDELKHYNINVIFFNFDDFKNYEIANYEFIKFIKMNKNSIDIFFNSHTFDKLYESTFQEIKKYGIPIVLIHFDSSSVPYLYLKESKYAECALLLTGTIGCKNIYDKYQCKVFSTHYASNPFLIKPQFNNTNNNICFIGTPYGTRVLPIRNLINNRIYIDLYSEIKDLGGNELCKGMKKNEIFIAIIDLLKTYAGRRTILGAIKSRFIDLSLDIKSKYISWNKPVNPDIMFKLYNDYSLSLSYSPVRNTGVLNKPFDIVCLRNMEIPMAGGLQFCKYYKELSECFEENKEIVFYRSDEEMIDKAHFYLNEKNEKNVLKMKFNARKKAEAEHKWIDRFDLAFNYLNIKY